VATDAAAHGGFELAGRRVQLRDFCASDEDDFLAWAAFEEMYTYMPFRIESPEAAKMEFRRLLGHPSRQAVPRRHWFLATLSPEGAFVGVTGFDHLSDGRVEFGWYLSPPYWRRGYATAATELILRFAFEELAVSEVTATCDPDNAASRRVLEKNGLRVVGEETRDTWRGTRPRLRLSLSRPASAW